jgi:hypothetical protein
MTITGSGTTLAYAEPDAQPVFPVRWALTGLAVFSIATLAERGCVWWMILSFFDRRGGLDLGLRDVVDYLLPPLAAAALLRVVFRERRSVMPALTRSLVALCAIQVLLALLSIAYWSATVLPRVWARRGGGGGHDAVVWEAELVYLRLLPVALPLMILGFARRGLPSPRTAAAALTFWSIATWTCAASATAALWHQRGVRAFSPDLYGDTVTPAWTFLLIPVIALGIVLWVGHLPSRFRLLACVLAWLLWCAAAMMRAWYDERMSSVRDGRYGALTNLSNLSGVIAELIADLILWQIAPIALLLFIARRTPDQVH